MSSHSFTNAVFFSPHSFIYAHNLAEYQLAKILFSNGINISVVQCDKDFSRFCTCMEKIPLDALSSDSHKLKICEKCVSMRDCLWNTEEFVRYSSQDFALQENVKVMEQIANIGNIADLLAFDYKQIPVGKISSYETLIKFKMTNFELTPFQMNYWKTSLINAIKTVDLAFAFFSRNQDVDLCFTYSPQYCVTGAFSAVAEKLGTKTFFVEGSSNDYQRYSHLRIWNWTKFGLRNPFINDPRFSSYKLKFAHLVPVILFTRRLSRATSFSVYSVAKTRINRDSYLNLFSIARHSKIMLMMLSSYDEVFSGVSIGRLQRNWMDGDVFSTQEDWVLSTMRWVSERPDLHCIIRIHPRMLPNGRDKVVTDKFHKLRLLFENLPRNVTLDLPERGVSIYDHFRHIDFATTGWSFTGIEALLKGIPVVSYDEKIVTFPREIHLSGNSAEEYFSNLDKVLLVKKSWQISLRAFRWLSFFYNASTIRVGGRIQDRVRLLNLPFFRGMLFRARRNFKLNSLILRVEKKPKFNQSDLEKLFKTLQG